MWLNYSRKELGLQILDSPGRVSEEKIEKKLPICSRMRLARERGHCRKVVHSGRMLASLQSGGTRAGLFGIE